MPDTQKKVAPKGGRKGGTTFPRLSLASALKYVEKLVTKTHTGPQAEKVVLKGVFDNIGSDGKIRASALKQFGLLEVDDKGYNASGLAQQVVASPEDEKTPLLRKACLAPAVFKTLYETFHSGEVPKAKIRQQALNVKVHLDAVDSCVDFFVESLEVAKLATVDGDKITIAAVPDTEIERPPSAGGADPPGDAGTGPAKKDDLSGPADDSESSTRGTHPRASIQVNVTLDSSLDTEKLEKQLKLLRQYGAI